jgi:hypothetical protein
MNMSTKPGLLADGANTTDTALCRAGGISALLAGGFAILQIVIEVIGVGFMRIPVPTDTLGWFTLLQKYRLLALTELTVLEIPALALCAPLFLALYTVLRRRKAALAAIATLLAFIGIAVYLSSNTAFSLLHLSNAYAAASSEAQRSMILAAGEAMHALYEGIGVDVGLFIFMIAVLLVSVISLGTGILTGVIPWVGTMASLLTLTYYAFSGFTSQAIFILEAAGVLLVIWLFLVGRRLLRVEGSFV